MSIEEIRSRRFAFMARFAACTERHDELHAEGKAILAELEKNRIESDACLAELEKCNTEFAAELDKIDAAGDRIRNALDLLGEIPKPR